MSSEQSTHSKADELVDTSKTITSLYSNFVIQDETDALQVELELNLKEEERRMAEEDWSKYRKGFRELKVRALALMQSKGSECSGRLDDQGITLRSGPEMVPAATSMHELAARLPRCDLPKFSGDFTEFRAFWDQFDYRVHQRKDLSNAAKLTYLRGCLTGKAADVISSLSVFSSHLPVH
ncbi:hypothetical protein T08_11763 [Trichinella sp. T8]|nr:hypothetical protein T08_11763 [Trichinella sp. T8]